MLVLLFGFLVCSLVDLGFAVCDLGNLQISHGVFLGFAVRFVAVTLRIFGFYSLRTVDFQFVDFVFLHFTNCTSCFSNAYSLRDGRKEVEFGCFWLCFLTSELHFFANLNLNT